MKERKKAQYKRRSVKIVVHFTFAGFNKRTQCKNRINTNMLSYNLLDPWCCPEMHCQIPLNDGSHRFLLPYHLQQQTDHWPWRSCLTCFFAFPALCGASHLSVHVPPAEPEQHQLFQWWNNESCLDVNHQTNPTRTFLFNY